MLPIAPSTYHQRTLETREPERASARSKTDAALRVEIARLWEENRQLYSARKSVTLCAGKVSTWRDAPWSG